MSLRFKLGILVTGFLPILISIHGVYSIHKQEEIHRSELIARGHSILTSLAIPCAVAIANSEIELLDTYLDLFKDEKLYNLDITHITVFDQNGVILSHTDQNEFGKRCTDEK
ncbi:MAG: hypothetical protein FJ088_03425, partial [Deltaproteobacteria bacterium]|nr:hypothetical protein [Deltaproteobacteria bacterium]